MEQLHETLERLKVTNPDIFKAIETLILSYSIAPVMESSSDTTGGGEHPPVPPDHP